MSPSQRPKPETFVIPVIPSVKSAGSLMVTIRLSLHPLASVTVTVYVPAAKFVAVSLV